MVANDVAGGVVATKMVAAYDGAGSVMAVVANDGVGSVVAMKAAVAGQSACGWCGVFNGHFFVLPVP